MYQNKLGIIFYSCHPTVRLKRTNRNERTNGCGEETGNHLAGWLAEKIRYSGGFVSTNNKTEMWPGRHKWSVQCRAYTCSPSSFFSENVKKYVAFWHLKLAIPHNKKANSTKADFTFIVTFTQFVITKKNQKKAVVCVSCYTTISYYLCTSNNLSSIFTRLFIGHCRQPDRQARSHFLQSRTASDFHFPGEAAWHTS